MLAGDRRLGMDRPIARRDFLNGVALGAGAIVGGMWPDAVTEGFANEAPARGQQSHYPPRLTGLRGSHPGSFELAHKLRDPHPTVPRGRVGWGLRAPGPAETYDLVIVGGGISGLSAAYFYREHKPTIRCSIPTGTSTSSHT
jgi:spermidine dehydrogenase